ARVHTLARARHVGGAALARAASWAEKLATAGRGPHPKVRQYLRQATLPLQARYFGGARGLGDDELRSAFGAAAQERLQERFAPLWQRSRGLPLLNRLLYADTKLWLPDELLLKADRMTMAWGIDLR